MEQIEELKNDLECLRDEEQEYLDNMPENMQSGEKYEKAENAIYEMEEAISNLEYALENIDNSAE